MKSEGDNGTTRETVCDSDPKPEVGQIQNISEKAEIDDLPAETKKETNLEPNEPKNEVVENDTEVMTTSTTDNTTNQKETFSSEQFQKSRNSRTAAMFQKHGKLLDDDKAASAKTKKSEVKKDEGKKSFLSCFSCCCRKK